MSEPVHRKSIAAFHEATADPDVFSGGGSVAAVTAAGAGATALLVMRLNRKRRVNRERLAEIDAAIAATSDAISRFHQAADGDLRILADLLAAQRELKAGGDRDGYELALRRAAESPLDMIDAIDRLLELIAAQVPLAARFTVSDLGAAAALAGGAGRAALLTADVNIALLAEHSESGAAHAGALDRRREALARRLADLPEAIEADSRRAIRAEPASGVDR